MIKIVQATHEDLLKEWKDISGSYLEEQVKLGLAKYYFIYDEEQKVSDFWIYTGPVQDEVELCIYNNAAVDKALIYQEKVIHLIFEQLKQEGYKRVRIQIAEEFSDRIELAEKLKFAKEPKRSFISLIKELS